MRCVSAPRVASSTNAHAHIPCTAHVHNMHMGDPYTGQRKGPAGTKANTPTRLPAAHTVSTENKHRMRVNHVREVCQERKPTLHAHPSTRTPQCTLSTLSPARPPGKGQRQAGKPLRTPGPFRDKLRPAGSSTEAGWGLGNS